MLRLNYERIDFYFQVETKVWENFTKIEYICFFYIFTQFTSLLSVYSSSASAMNQISVGPCTLGMGSSNVLIWVSGNVDTAMISFLLSSSIIPRLTGNSYLKKNHASTLGSLIKKKVVARWPLSTFLHAHLATHVHNIVLMNLIFLGSLY